MQHLVDSIATSLADLPGWLATMIISAMPIAELRGGIPVAVGVYDLAIMEAYLWAVIGNMIPVFFILWLLPSISKWLSERSKYAKRFFDWLFARTKRKFYDKHEKWGNFALFLFVAIPLPVTGAWTGSLAAFLFGIPKKQAIPYIFLGVLTAGVIISLATAGVITIF